MIISSTQLMNKITFVLLFISGILTAQVPANWHALGPIQFPINSSGQINGIGRVCQMKFHPSNSQKVYAVSASGGLWLSSNATLNWQKCGTDQIPLTACASVCIDYTNDSILYLGTGDPNYYSPSYGIYKSIDAGSTWQPSNSTIGSRMALEIIMDPTDHLSLVAATNDGIWKTTDGGLTWSVKKSGGAFTDMEIKPAIGTRTLFAVTFSEFWKSEDFGDTWNIVTNGIAVPGGGSGQGMRLAVSSADSTIVYAGMIKDEGTIFKSIDGGNTFSTVYHNPAQSLVGYDANGNGQGNYNFTMCADPGNPNIVFVGAHVVWRSTDGGVTWTKLTSWSQVLHTDMHDMLFNPYNTLELYNINDGGVWRSLNAGVNWSARSNGLEATEIYHAASNPLRKDIMSIGTQDNGELYSINGQWKTNRGGDWGSVMTYDYVNANLVYYHENGKRRNVNGGGEVNFGFPVTTSNNTKMAFTPLNSNYGLAGNTDVYLSSDLNNSVPSWYQVSSFNTTIKAIHFAVYSEDIAYVLTAPNTLRKATGINSGTPTWTSTSVPTAVSASGNIETISGDTNVVYITAGTKVYRSSDQGATWSNITLNLPAINILKIFHDPYSTDESIYVGNAAGVWYKNQNMTSWYNYSQGLPLIANINDFMFYDDGPFNSVIRVATYGRGVWETGLIPTITGIADQEKYEQLILSPNPAGDYLEADLNLAGKNKISNYSIFNNIGQLIFTKEISNSSSSKLMIVTSGLPEGNYHLILSDSKGNRLASSSFIKK